VCRLPARCATAGANVVPERPDAVLVESGIVGGRLALGYLVNSASRLELRGLDGALIREIPLPGVGSTSVLSGEHDGSELFFDFTSFTTPVVIFRLNLQTDALTEWASVPSPLDPEGLNVEQVWYDSTDGARVSMFLVHRRGLVRDGSNPVLLTGYGGFNINRVPEYRGSIAFWLEQGGIYALPNLRGGGEYGERWHASGMLAQKQHTFDDFIGAAQYLVDAGYTTPERLAILGGSNGGLLVGADHHAATRPISCRRLPGAAARHAPLPPVPHRPAVDRRVRQRRRPGAVRLAQGLLALSQHR